ncbi:MAG: hypothetical protein RLY31_2545 [Bacteroidota bacterium]|jgi:hypothetical protein
MPNTFRLLPLLSLFTLVASIPLSAQGQALSYYLPAAEYNPVVPTPSAFFGFEIGEWHLSHDQVIAYYRALASASDRITIQEHGRTYEDRPLIHLIITSPGQHARLPEIQAMHKRLCDPEQSAGLNTSDMPLVLYQGFTIHGNEPSGAHAAVLVAYYLAAARDAAVVDLLDRTVILFDPVFNPDGMQRFSTWVNMHRNMTLTDDPADREFSEGWPRGRTNHYWFDLNRDWLPAQHPESQGRVRLFQSWRPNILTDHHEMGTHSTFFFMPGIQSRVNPVTPAANQDLTFRIGEYHARALNGIRSMYYTQESYDDFYYGKGSTYPDAQGCIGILFEQASSRGHRQQSRHGVLTFPFTIRNQVTTALSTHAAALALRKELLDYQRDFYRQAKAEAAQDTRKAFIVGTRKDRSRLLKFVEMISRHEVRCYGLARETTVGQVTYQPDHAVVIPLEQAQYKLLLGMFQRDTTFTDSIFYDISAWTLPLAFDLDYAALTARQFQPDLLGDPVSDFTLAPGKLLAGEDDYAFAFEWDEYYAPAALQHLQRHGLRTQVATRGFRGETTGAGPLDFPIGTIVIPTQGQAVGPAERRALLLEAADLGHLTIHGLSTGLTAQGIDIGSNYMEVLEAPKVALLVGQDVSPYDAGEIWHLLDTRYRLPVTKIETDRLSPSVLARFNVLLMPPGSYRDLPADAVRNWLAAGGVLVAYENAIQWLEGRQLAPVVFRSAEKPVLSSVGTYASAREDRDARELSGAIFEAETDLTHPLLYGFDKSSLPLFRTHDLFMDTPENPYSAPIRYTASPLLAGYRHASLRKLAAGSPAAIIGGLGAGKVICLTDNTNFRAFWYGTNKILANAIFFGRTISSLTVEKNRKK